MSKIDAKFYLVASRVFVPVVGVGVVVLEFFLWLIRTSSGFCFCWLFVLSRGLNTPFGGFKDFRPCCVLWCVGGWILDINGEFDPGSGRTLAACLTHASRTVILESLLFG